MAETPLATGKSGIQQRFATALDALVEQVKRDRSILAALLCGSLSHDTVWEKSDIDLILITIDEKQIHEGGLSLYAAGINVHASLMSRAEFRKTAEGAVRNSFIHSLMAKGRLLYTHDESITGLCDRLRVLGDRDTRRQLLAAASHAIPCLYKAHKWLITRGDLEYTALWILHAVNELAKVELLEAGLLVDREALPRALELNPAFFELTYTGLLNRKKTNASVRAALSAVDDYLLKRASTIFAPVIDHLEEVGEARSATEIENHFQRDFGIGGVSGVCEYLADRGLAGKASIPVRLTKRSNTNVQELAFFRGTGPPDAR